MTLKTYSSLEDCLPTLLIKSVSQFLSSLIWSSIHDYFLTQMQRRTKSWFVEFLHKLKPKIISIPNYHNKVLIIRNFRSWFQLSFKFNRMRNEWMGDLWSHECFHSWFYALTFGRSGAIWQEAWHQWNPMNLRFIGAFRGCLTPDPQVLLSRSFYVNTQGFRSVFLTLRQMS